MADTTTGPRHIVVALDSSDHSKHALKWTLDNVVRQGDNILLVSVAHKDDYGDSVLWGAKGSPYIPLAEFEERRSHLLDPTVIASLRIISNEKNLEIVGQMHYGDPREKVLDACQQVGADLLVMGSRGLGSVKRVLLGSVSTYIVAHAACPVTVVKKP